MTDHRNRTGFVLQPLEDRTLFAGLTVIAHGIEPEGDRAAWLDAMADAIVAGTSEETSIYALLVAPTEDPEFFDLTLEWIGGIAAIEGENAEVVLLIDWSDISDPAASDTTVSDIGFFASEYLFEPDAELGIDFPWAELPLHLIGHGRGAGVVSEIAWYAGNYGVWIDQLTLLDPPSPERHPDDQPAAVYENVHFADAYYQTVAEQQGAPVGGAVNFDLSEQVTAHAGIHEWYLHTMLAGGDGIGYDFSRIVGGPRDALGIGENFTADGLAPRDAGERISAQYPNVGLVRITDPGDSVLQGHPLSFEFLFQDHDSDGEVEYYLDEDTNPYNENAWFLAGGLCQSAGEEISLFAATPSTADVPSGVYHLFIFVTDGDGQVRYAYADSTVTLVATAPTVGSLLRSAARVGRGEWLTLSASDVSPDALAVSFAHDTNGDGAYDPDADQLLSIDTDGADGWSFSGRIDHLPSGSNGFFAIATDADQMTSSPAATSVIRDTGDAFESNDTRSASSRLGLQSRITAHERLNLSDGDKDWFRLRIGNGADRRHAIKINYKDELGDLSLKLYDADGRLLRRGAHSLNKELISLNRLSGGTYYIRITGDAHPKYKLTIDAPGARAPTAAAMRASDAPEQGRFPFTFSLFNTRRRIAHPADALL